MRPQALIVTKAGKSAGIGVPCYASKWRVKRNRNANPENWWNINILRGDIKRRSPAQLRSAEIIACYQRGQSGKKIAVAMGLSEGAVYRVIAATSATKKRTPGKVQQLRAEIVALYEMGVGPKGIAEQLQVGKTAVNRTLRAAAVPPRTRRGRTLKPDTKISNNGEHTND